MSLDALLWAVKDAPVADVQERAVLTIMADEADEAGCGSFLSIPTIAERARIVEREVRRCMRDMQQRGLLGLGEQSLAAYIRADRRPIVYDLMIPFTAFANVNRVNTARAAKGLAPLTMLSRPDIDPAPDKKRRSDAGTKRRKPNGGTSSHVVIDEGTISPGGLQAQHGGTGKSADRHLSTEVSGKVPPPRGDYQSADPVLNPEELTPPRARGREATWAPAQRVAEPEPGGGEDSPDDQTRIAKLASRLQSQRGWPLESSSRILAQALTTGRPWNLIERVMARIAADPTTERPGRLLAVPESWWTDAAAQPPPERPRMPWCGNCIEHTRRLIDPVTYDDRGQCPTCHPAQVGAAA